MESGSSFERFIRLVQETGERMVVALDPTKDPVVILPLSAYETLVGRREESVSAPSRSSVLPLSDARASEDRRPSALPPIRRSEPPRTPLEAPRAFVRTPIVPAADDLAPDPVDAWDGETGEEYDAERIFASAEVGKGFGSSSDAPDRLKASVSRASEAYGMLGKGGWQAGNGGQRLPISPDAHAGEERFSLGMG